jgi:antirestriction protein ArdC
MARITYSAEDRKARLDAASAQLEAAVSTIVTGEDWQRALAFAGRFHHYSANNVLLIMAQCIERGIEAHYVAGYRTWQALGRQVRRGEKGLAVLAPCKYRTIDEETGEETWQVRGFRVEHVFADSQCDGEGDLPTRPAPQLLTGDGPEGLWDAIVAMLSERGYRVERQRYGSENGRTDYAARLVTIAPDLESAAACKTLVHELSHAILHEHRLGEDRGQVECEAESTAFLVLDAVGLDAGGYSFAYTAGWSGGKAETVTAALENAKRCAADILEGLGSLELKADVRVAA